MMEISQLDFIRLFVASLLMGVLLGAVYDAVRVVRVLVGAENIRGITSSIFVALGDVAFAVACGVSAVAVAYSYNNGNFRAVIPFGLILGFFVYYFTVGKLVMAAARALARAVKYIMSQIKRGVGKIKMKGAKNDARNERNDKKKNVAQ